MFADRLRGRLLPIVGLWLALTALPGAAAADTAADLRDFDFMVAKVEANYSGWPTKVAGDRRAALDALTARLRAQVAAGGDGALHGAVGEWLAWFDDGHLQAQWRSLDGGTPWRVPPRPLTEAAARARIAAADRAPVEGLWTIDDRYRLAVVRGASGAFDAVVLATGAEGWAPGDVKAVLTGGADGRFAVRYGTGDRSELRLSATLRAGGDVLDLGDLGVWRRIHDDPAKAQAALRRWPDDAFAVTRLDADTLVLRLPSFHDSHTDTIRALVDRHADDLRRTRHLIIDVRGNGGGSDFAYDPVLPYLYTGPIRRAGVEIRVSPDNARLRREVADQIAAASPEGARVLRGESQRMATATGPFIRRDPPPAAVRFPAPLPNPVRVAILIDRAASSAESFLLDARQSTKVVLMGQENSAGILDFGEMMGMEAPSGRFVLAWATTRSLRLPNDPVDPHGLAPTVRIPADTDDPLAFAAGWLARQAAR